MSLFVVDVESDGPAPELGSMVSFAAVKVTRSLSEHFYAQMAPICDQWDAESLAISGVSRDEQLKSEDPKKVMERFAEWIQRVNEPGTKISLVSDNPAFDWQFINYYLHKFVGSNPFGHSARRIGDFTAGLEREWGASSKFKKMRKTKHTHHPLDDAKGNAEALIAMCDAHRIKLPGVRKLAESSAPESPPPIGKREKGGCKP